MLRRFCIHTRWMPAQDGKKLRAQLSKGEMPTLQHMTSHSRKLAEVLVDFRFTLRGWNNRILHRFLFYPKAASNALGEGT